MHPIVVSLSVAFALTACGGNMPQAQKEAAAVEIVQLFAQGCAAWRGDATQVAEWAERQQFTRLNAEAVKRLPHGMMEQNVQTVWQTERNGTVFYLNTNAEGCSVKTVVADETAVRKQLAAVAEQAGAKVKARFHSDETATSIFPFRRLTYAWQFEDGKRALLTANTSPSDYVPVQAALFFARQPAEN